eukprot:m51a1_g8217 hypothetical protein (571) ;mRNA; r:87530-89620
MSTLKGRFPRKGVTRYILVHAEGATGDGVNTFTRAVKGYNRSLFPGMGPAAPSDAPQDPSDPSDPAQEPETAEEAYDRRQWELGEYGFPDDGYDYSQHFKTMGGGKGVFVGKDGKVGSAVPLDATVKPQVVPALHADATSAAPGAAEAPAAAAAAASSSSSSATGAATAEGMGEAVFVPQDSAEEQRRRHYREVALDEVDEDVRRVLAGDVVESGDDDMPDDFIAQLMEADKHPPQQQRQRRTAAPEEDEGDEGEEEDEQEAAAAAMMMRAGGGGRMTMKERVKMAMMREGDLDVRAIEEQRLADVLLAEYDDEQIGGLSGDEGTRGGMSVDDVREQIAEDPRVAAVAMPGERKRRAALRRNEDLLAADLPSDEDEAEAEGYGDRRSKAAPGTDEVAAEDKEDVKKCTLRLLARQRTEKEEVVLSESDDEMKWDCETILTTYTNRTNIPVMIGDGEKIKLRRGLPVDARPEPVARPRTLQQQQQQQHRGRKSRQDEVDEEDEPRQNLGEARKDETPEQRRERKKAIKEQKRMARERKKETRGAYATAQATQTRIVQAETGTANKHTIVRY